MRLMHSKDRSIVLTCFLMKFVGIWIATNPAEQRRRNFALIYTIWILIVAWCMAIRDLYFSWGNFADCIYIVSNILYLMVALFKISVLYTNRRKFYDLVTSTEQKFPSSSDDHQEQKILLDCKRLSSRFILFTTFCAQGTCIGYALTPLFENVGKNESERILPFNLWIDLPIGLSPYFEVLFTIQMLCVYHVAISFLCFDNFLCLVSLNITGQFRILQHRLRIEDDDLDPSMSRKAIKYRIKLKRCVIYHQTIIDYCRKLEEVFTLMILADVLFLAILLCIMGFQTFLMVVPPARRIGLILALIVLCSQLLMFTYCWDGLIRESVSVGQAAYVGPWNAFSMNKIGKALRSDVLMIIMRSNESCCLTAGGFFPVSLETCTAVLSTAMSYFTVLKNSASDVLNT